LSAFWRINVAVFLKLIQQVSARFAGMSKSASQQVSELAAA
jgi:hypothetical protein